MAKAGNDPRVAIVTDSTAYPAPEMALAMGVVVHVIPLSLTLGGNIWRDGVDISPSEFYAQLESGRGFPTTSQPSVGAFQELFESLASRVDGIVCVLVSREITATIDSALAAAANLPQLRIEVVDSRGTAMMLGFAVLEAARVSAAGGDVVAVAEAARRVAPRSQLYFAVGTLEYLHRGGRIGLAAKLLGSALSLKPIVRFKDGAVEPVTKMRTMRKAVDALTDLLGDHVGTGARAHVAVFHVNEPAEGDRFRDMVEARFRPVELIQTEVSPVLGAHGGPGTVGFAVYVE